jgi:hypothetical protein
MPDYPFVPRTNATLVPGQFWSIPLTDGRFACGRVLAARAIVGQHEVEPHNDWRDPQVEA